MGAGRQVEGESFASDSRWSPDMMWSLGGYLDVDVRPRPIASPTKAAGSALQRHQGKETQTRSLFSNCPAAHSEFLQAN